jgi:hypothetical protein
MSKTANTPHTALLAYLQRIPTYPFDAKIDPDFVDELITDFTGVLDVLEETKAFRWYHVDQATTTLRSPRLSLRRWLSNANQPRRR